MSCLVLFSQLAYNIMSSVHYKRRGVDAYVHGSYSLILQSGQTALLAATFVGHLDVVHQLLKHGANPDLRLQAMPRVAALVWEIHLVFSV